MDSVGKHLINAARYIEQHGLPPEDPHPLRALSLSLQEAHTWAVWRPAYYAAASRLHDACGVDNMDLSPEEAIDCLVAAAYWNTPEEGSS